MERLYTRFHGVEPNRIQSKRVWTPGTMTLMGRGVDIGYRVGDTRSSKGTRVPYVHDFDSGVAVYHRSAAQHGASVRTWTHFPEELMVLGANIGFSYRDSRGVLHEVKGSSSKKLAVTPDGRTLVVLDGKGVLYLVEGGSMYVDDWIRN